MGCFPAEARRTTRRPSSPRFREHRSSECPQPLAHFGCRGTKLTTTIWRFSPRQRLSRRSKTQRVGFSNLPQLRSETGRRSWPSYVLRRQFGSRSSCSLLSRRSAAPRPDARPLRGSALRLWLKGVVAKTRSSRCRPGERGWVKFKNPNYWRRDEEREALVRSRDRRARTLAGSR